jgi:hypothetical protein
MISKQLAAGLIAAVLTAGAAGAAVTVNLATNAADSPTQAGQLVSQVEPTTTAAPAPPSTIYVDVTIPDLPPVTAESAPAPAPEVVVETGSAGGSGSSGGSRGGSGSSGGWNGSTDPSGGSFSAVADTPAPAFDPAPAPTRDDDRDSAGEREAEHPEDHGADNGGSDDD